MIEVSAVCVTLDGMVMVIGAPMMTNVLWASGPLTLTALIMMNLSTANVNPVSSTVVAMSITFATTSTSETLPTS